MTDIAFLKDGTGAGSGSGDPLEGHRGATLVVSVRDSNYLRLLDVARVVEQVGGFVSSRPRKKGFDKLQDMSASRI